ncbi:MAG TPA: CBS domain-containing protein [Acidimicrobiia bacterium]|jgi:CBS domain-containing protein|nr:CBS domain-containing protein [Acidimicrobiia bacterium]
MPQSIRDVMTADPVRVPEDMNIIQLAEIMRDRDIGDVIVSDGAGVVGIVTDRDIVVRGLASGDGVEMLSAGDVASRDVRTVSPDDPVGTAVKYMSDMAIRRLPVVENGELVGVVSLGDLAMERDPESALSDISEAPPNN